jgi:chorismate-pyruvate lyase
MDISRCTAGLLPSPQPRWQLNRSAGSTAAGDERLSGPWRLLLLGDGSPTRHLESLTGEPVEIELIAMAPEPTNPPGDGAQQPTSAPPPPEIAELDGPLLRRQVWLRCGGQTLAWAESWWNQQQADVYLQQREQPIWRSLTSHRAELFREVDGLALVDAPWLEERFGEPGPFWSRHYRFFRGGRELTVIREVFSPALERWLGPATTGPGEALSQTAPQRHNSLQTR